MLQGGLGSLYIAQGIEREPMDQTDFDVWLRCIQGGGGRILQKLVEGSLHSGPSGM